MGEGAQRARPDPAAVGLPREPGQLGRPPPLAQRVGGQDRAWARDRRARRGEPGGGRGHARRGDVAEDASERQTRRFLRLLCGRGLLAGPAVVAALGCLRRVGLLGLRREKGGEWPAVGRDRARPGLSIR